MVPADSKEQLAQRVRVKTMVALDQFLRQHGRQVAAWVYPFERISTFVREYQAIRTMHFSDIADILCQPSLIAEGRGDYTVRAEVLKEFLGKVEEQFNPTQASVIRETCLRREGIVLMQGPPGTGKTHTLQGLLSGLHYYLKKI